MHVVWCFFGLVLVITGLGETGIFLARTGADCEEDGDGDGGGDDEDDPSPLGNCT